jgi:hypothetical protein
MKNNGGIPPPLTPGLSAGATSPMNAAMKQSTTTANLTASLANAGGKTKGGATNGGQASINVSVPTPMYKSTGPQSVQNVTVTGAAHIAKANSLNEGALSKVAPVQPIKKGGCGCDWKGGKRKRKSKKGGTYIVKSGGLWAPCYSGGKKRTNKNNKKRKSRSSRKRRR